MQDYGASVTAGLHQALTQLLVKARRLWAQHLARESDVKRLGEHENVKRPTLHVVWPVFLPRTLVDAI